MAEEVLDACTGNPLTSGYYCLIAENEGRAAGYVCYGNTPLTKGNWEMYWIAVDPASQGLGIGRELMHRAEAGIRSRGGWQVTLETSSTPLYDKTRRFYLRCGYTEIARIPDFYDRGDDLVISEKTRSGFGRPAITPALARFQLAFGAETTGFGVSLRFRSGPAAEESGAQNGYIGSSSANRLPRRAFRRLLLHSLTPDTSHSMQRQRR